ncbi:MAG: COX15/CtaA family protein [Myxococcota bacterium]|nr:COX15/CtaA family protein [Myxococcota bacterium]
MREAGTNTPQAQTSAPFVRAAWAQVAYLLFVILWGSWVRITHSGAGCGDHWPLCNGEVLPIAPSLETVIEFTHRTTSGLCGLFAIALFVWSWRKFGPAHRVCRAAAASLVLVCVEGAIGAGLVLGELVADDDSVARAVVIALHLTNTLVLMACASLTAWWAMPRQGPSTRAATPPSTRWVLLGTLAALVLVGATGAVTALGDTLFPIPVAESDGLMSRVRQDLSAANHFLVRLRILHPVLAIAVAMGIWSLADTLSDREDPSMLPRLVRSLVVVQVGLGFLTVALAAPGWLQLVHLLGAQGLWIALVLSTERFLSREQRTPA